MPIYDYRCGCGARFEAIVASSASPPSCPACGGATSRLPSAPALGGQARTGLSQEQMPQTWRGTHEGNAEYVTGLRRQWEKREKLEARHPELAGDKRPIIAHEGRYHDKPLRTGDPIGPAATGHGHGHGHSHGAGPAKPAPKPD